MDIYHLPAEQPPAPACPRSIALGIFDGLHSGHRAVIAAALHAGGGRCAVYTFAPGTVSTKPGNGRLCTAQEETAILTQIGVQELFVTDFAAVRQLTPEQFVRDILVGQLHAGTVACGYNYRFGHGGCGDAATLKQLCAAYGVAVTVLPPIEAAGQPVSSSAIRRALAEGDMPLARRLLGRGYCLRLPVIHGRQLGRRLGTPTVNQLLPADFALPRFGVYACAVELDGQTYTGVTNIGVRPTVGADAPLAETWIQGFSGDLYGRTVAVYPVRFLRPEQKFADVAALCTQVQADGAAAAALFTPAADQPIRAVLLDFDDTVHRRDDAFAEAMRQFLHRAFPALPVAEFNSRLQELIAYNNYGYGMPCSYEEFFVRFLSLWPGSAVTPQEAYGHFCTDFAAACRLCADVLPAIERQRKRGLLIGAITNGSSLLQNAKLDLSGLRPHLDIAAVGEDESIQKPDPRLFRRIAARLGLPCAACLYVGDNPGNDIAGALAAGMRPVWIDRGFAAGHPSYAQPVPPQVPVIRSLAGLDALT